MRKVEQAYAAELVQPGPGFYTGHLSAPVVGLEDGVDEEEEEEEKDDWHSVSSSTSILEETDIIAFRAQCGGVIGRLIVYSSGVRFVRSLVKKDIWKHNFLELAEMRKLEGGTKSKLKLMPLEQLEFKTHGWDDFASGSGEEARRGIQYDYRVFWNPVAGVASRPRKGRHGQ